MRSMVELELFGVDKSAQYQSVRHQLITELNKAGVNFQVTEISDISKFIETGLDSVPAIRVDGERLFSIPDHTDVSAAVGLVVDYIVTQRVRSVLVPVDFSAHSERAVHYGLSLSKAMGLGLELMHVYHPVVDPHNAVILDAELGTVLENQLSEMVSVVGAERSSNTALTRSRFEIGFPVQTITEASFDTRTELVVMGTLGADTVVDQVLGSNSSAVALKAGRPVLLVPPDSEFKPLKHIVVAFSKELLESENAFSDLLGLNAHFNAHIDFVHFGELENESFQAIQDKLVQQILNLGAPQFSFDVHEVGRSGSNVADDIQTYADEHRPDMLVLVAQQRNFIQGLFHSSVTRKICLHPHGPILVLHGS